MANRVLTSLDIAGLPWAAAAHAKVGDILIDTPTGTHADGKLIVDIQNGSTVFPDARLGATVWIDGSIGTFYHWRLRGNLSGDMAEWVGISDETHYVTVKPVPGTKVLVKRNASSNGGFLFLVSNIKFCKIDGENDAFPGLRDGWPGTFLTGKFGFHFDNDIYPIGGHTLSISSPDGGHFIVRGTEHTGGFAAIRYAGGDYYAVVKITIERVYMHDAGDGEGAYLGATHGTPYVLLKCEMRDLVIANRACEGIQIQHIISGVGENLVVENFVNFCPAMDGIDAFIDGQDTGIQWSQASGGNILRNGITDGAAWSSVAINHFGTTDHPGTSVDPTVMSKAENLLFHNIGGILSYIHNSNIDGVWKLMRRVYSMNFSNRYYYDNVNDLANYYVSAHNGTNRLSFIDCFHDGVKAQFFQDTDDMEYINIQNIGYPGAPVYMNSGFFEPTSDIMNWKRTYANYFDDPTVDKPVTYLKDWVVVNIEQGVEYAYYKVMSTHTTSGVSALNPRADVAANGNVRYKKLTWDTFGVRNLLADGSVNPSWNSGTAQSTIPPHDLRLVADNYWNKRGMGLYSNPHNTDYVQVQWFRNTTATSVGAKMIPGAKTIDYAAQEADMEKYVAMAIKRKDSDGNWDADWQYGNWVLVPGEEVPEEPPSEPTPSSFIQTSYPTTNEGSEDILIYFPQGWGDTPGKLYHTHLYFGGDGSMGSFIFRTGELMTNAGGNLYTHVCDNPSGTGNRKVFHGSVVVKVGGVEVARCKRTMNGTTATFFSTGAIPGITGTINISSYPDTAVSVQFPSSPGGTVTIDYSMSKMFETGLAMHMNNGEYEFDDTLVVMVQKGASGTYYSVVDHYEDLMEYLLANYPQIDTDRITVSGLSRGGVFVEALAESSHVGEIAAFLQNSGLVFSVADWSVFSNKGVMVIAGQNEGLDGYSVPNGTMLNTTGAITNLRNYPGSIMVEGGRHNNGTWGTNCYNPATAIFDFRDWLRVWSIDYERQATLHVEMAEARVDIDRWREAKRAVFFMTAGAAKTALEARLTTLKATIDGGKKTWVMKLGVTAEVDSYLNINYLNANFQNSVYSSLKDDNNNVTGVGLRVDSQLATSDTDRFSVSTRGSNPQFGFTRENYVDGANMHTAVTTGQFTLTGLSPTKTYRFKAYLANGSTSTAHVMKLSMTIGGVNKIAFVTYTNRRTLEFTGITPNASGEIVVNASASSGDTTIIMQLLQLREE